MSPTAIRPRFLLDHLARHEAAWSKRHELIAARDDKHRELNRRYGFRDPDGSIPIGFRSHVNLPYKAEYDRIENDFRPAYEAITTAAAQADRDQGMTIYEFLVLDNLDAAERDKFLVAARAGRPVDYVSLPANSEVSRRAAGATFDSMPRLLQMLTSDTSYAVRRCRKFLALKPWDSYAWRAIAAYRLHYNRALRDAAKSLRFQPPH